MKRAHQIFFGLILVFSSCIDPDIFGNGDGKNKTDYFAVANRGDGTVTIYNADTQDKFKTIIISNDDAAPTYVVYSKEKDLLYVADFNNKMILAYETVNFDEVATMDVGQGAFHMWLNDHTGQLWVNNIVDKTTSVLDIHSESTLAKLSLPGTIDFNEDAAQHDVIISPDGAYAYVSVISKAGVNYILQYNTQSFQLINYIEVGGDPHVAVTKRHLYVLSQAESSITEHNLSSLSKTGKGGTLANAHGITPGNNNNLFLTNIADKKVASYNIARQIVGSITDASDTPGVAHNIAFNPDKNILALTHSGGTTLDFFKARDRAITLLGTDESGANPFGIVYIDR